jgi:hypothetical protein
MPTHTTILNWTKKHGISHFHEPSFFGQQQWVLIADESIQFGNKKLLLILAVPESRCRQNKALSYKDLRPLVLKVSSSWKSEEIMSEISRSIDLQQIAYCISDTGSNLTCAFKGLKIKHISDINHAISLIIKSIYEENPFFVTYTKELSSLRVQKSMSKIARIVPPNQRVMNRFMNLTPLFEWGTDMLSSLDNNLLLPEEKTAVSFLEPMREFIFDTYQILLHLKTVEKLLKNNGFNHKTEKEALSVLSELKSENSLKIIEKLKEYFSDLSSKSEGNTVCCSSDIIESCFGKYKAPVNGNKTVGISDLSLCIAAMSGHDSRDSIKESMEKVSMKKLKEWKTENISKTLFAEKRELKKKVGRGYFKKE